VSDDRHAALERLVQAVRHWSDGNACADHGPYEHEYRCSECADEVARQQGMLDALTDVDATPSEAALEEARTALREAKARLSRIVCAECDRTMDACGCDRPEEA